MIISITMFFATIFFAPGTLFKENRIFSPVGYHFFLVCLRIQTIKTEINRLVSVVLPNIFKWSMGAAKITIMDKDKGRTYERINNMRYFFPDSNYATILNIEICLHGDWISKGIVYH